MRITVLAFLSFIAICFINRSYVFKSVENRLYFAPPLEVTRFTLGYSDTFADTLWIRFLQDIDLCEQQLNPNAAVSIGANRIANCKKAWGYHMLNLILELSPRFKRVAMVGPLSLSVIVDDIEGASLIFDKVLSLYPDDWSMTYQAAYHFLWEVEDFLKAAELFKKAGDLGAPEWVYSLSAKLYTRKGQAMVAKTVLQDFLNRGKDALANRDRKKLEQRLKEVNKILEEEHNSQ